MKCQAIKQLEVKPDDEYEYFHICERKIGHLGQHKCFLCWLTWNSETVNREENVSGI